MTKSAQSRPGSRKRTTAKRTTAKRTTVKARRRKSSRRALSAALLVVAASGGVVACQEVEKQAAAPTSSSSAAAPTTATTPAAAPVVWPLTGVATTAVADRPALAVKIENSITARPQTGLDDADMVYEEVVEGGITRYVAVFHSNLPPQIGPVRSIRPMDAAIAGPLHGVLAFSGGIPLFITRASNAGLQVLSQDGGGKGFHRISSRPAPHNVYADPSVLVGQADANHRQAPAPQFDFPAPGGQPTAATAGTPANVLHLTLSGVGHPNWTWSAADSKWLRAEGSTPAVNSDGKRLAATNVVVVRVDLVNTAARDAANNPVPETVLTGKGQALVATAGRTVTATWSKASATDRIVLTGADGRPVTLAPGNTWVELVPNGTGSVTTG